MSGPTALNQDLHPGLPKVFDRGFRSFKNVGSTEVLLVQWVDAELKVGRSPRLTGQLGDMYVLTVQ
jgi:hypothetical protein